MSSKHSISLDQAKKMTGKFREDKKKVIKDEYHGKHILPRCETFEKAAFEELLATPGCAFVRAYYGMDDDKKVHLIFVAVNSNNEDILPGSASTEKTAASVLVDDGGVIVENGARCPDECPPSSPLNP